MDIQRVSEIKEEMRKRPDADLLSIWIENDRDNWLEEAFQAIRELLQERNLAIPAQKPFVHKPFGQKSFVLKWCARKAIALARDVLKWIAQNPIYVLLAGGCLGNAVYFGWGLPVLDRSGNVSRYAILYLWLVALIWPGWGYALWAFGGKKIWRVVVPMIIGLIIMWRLVAIGLLFLVFSQGVGQF